MAANQTANFVVKAKDAATGPLGKVGGSMGKLRRTSVTVFKGIATAALAAAGAIAAFTASAVKGAIEDQRSVILTNAALKARGFELDKIGPKIEEQISAMARFGKTDDEVRAGLEVGSRFFKNQEQLLAANATAAMISSVTGRDLAEVMGLIGKAANGQTRGLAALIGPIQKGAKFTDILNQSNVAFKETAEALANSIAGQAVTAQIAFNEEMDRFGDQFLPLVTEALKFLVEKVFPEFQKVLAVVGPAIGGFVDEFVRPLVDSFAELFSVFAEGEGSISLLDVAFFPLKATLTAIKVLIDAIVFGLNLIGIGKGSGAAQALNAAAANAGYGGGSFVNATNAGGVNAAALSSTYIIPITIGTGKVDTVVADSIKRIGPGPRRGR